MTATCVLFYLSVSCRLFMGRGRWLDCLTAFAKSLVGSSPYKLTGWLWRRGKGAVGTVVAALLSVEVTKLEWYYSEVCHFFDTLFRDLITWLRRDVGGASRELLVLMSRAYVLSVIDLP